MEATSPWNLIKFINFCVLVCFTGEYFDQAAWILIANFTNFHEFAAIRSFIKYAVKYSDFLLLLIIIPNLWGLTFMEYSFDFT